MNFTKIKNLVRQNGDKFIFVENGEPEIVVMSFQEYEKLANGDRSSHKVEVLTSSGGLNNTVDDPVMEGFEETEFMAPALTGPPGLPIRLEDIRLEDLPV